MPSFTQANQPIELATPLGKDALLITAFNGEEGISRLFHFRIEAIADTKKEIAFDKLLGQKVGIRLTQTGGKQRFFAGICNRVAQGGGDNEFTTYQLEIVPQFWLLTKKAQSRAFPPRNYCVQYRETDFNFACRLMEDEGIYYYFTHTAEGHKMVLGNTPSSHPDMPTNNKLAFAKDVTEAWPEDRVLTWEKQQELVSGNFTLWDHKFEMHGRNLETKKTLVDSVQVGKVAHKLKAGNADAREVFDYPGTYANRFDGIDPGGSEQTPEINKILQEKDRVIAIRAQEEAVRGVIIHGTSTCRNLISGHKFTLEKHGPADGDYVLTGVHHQTTMPLDYRSGDGGAKFQYANALTAIPLAVPFRPQRVTPKPFVQGTQTAIVVGASGQEIDCDKYGRVKVKFPWDREGKQSCWIRVATHWAGEKWGIVHIPRIGHEVVVGFEEGDPDLPIIIGSVYNNDHMPPYTLPDNKTQSGVKSRSSLQGTEANFNEIRFEDLKGKEQVIVHAEKDMATSVEANQNNTIGHNHVMTVGTDPNGDPKKDGTSTTTIFGDTKLTVTKGDYTVTIKAGSAYLNVETHNREVDVKEQYKLLAKNIYAESRVEFISFKAATSFDVVAATFIEHQIGESANFMKVKNDGTATVSGTAQVQCQVGEDIIRIKPGEIMVTSTGKVVLQAPGGSITIDSAGITIDGKKILSKAKGVNEVKGSQVKLNC
jgi:type VI secretion system secreted protein VgrG